MSYYIYKICCDDCPEFNYIGSTKAFRQRKQEHKQCCNNENSKKNNLKLYSIIRANGGWDNWRMVIIEECGEISFTQARIKEEENRVKLNANLNMKKCHLTEEQKQEYREEWKEQNKDKIKEKNKEYSEENREKKKEYCEENREKIKEKKKEYYEKNREKISEKRKEYREKNKERIKEQHGKKITCECGKIFTHNHKARHEKTDYHQDYINNK